MIPFPELVIKLHSTEPQPNPTYYKTLLEHPETILLQVAKTDQKSVALALKMSPAKLSNYIPMFKELANANDNG